MSMNENGQDAVHITDAAHDFVENARTGDDEPIEPTASSESDAGESKAAADENGETTSARGKGRARGRSRGGRGRAKGKDKLPEADEPAPLAPADEDDAPAPAVEIEVEAEVEEDIAEEVVDVDLDEADDAPEPARPSRSAGERTAGPRRGTRAEPRSSTPASSGAKEELVINYVPGEECRVAVLRDGRLEEFHAERVESASHVGNIYVGKVANVEPQIQAAFIDFGLEHNGFLHISDLHPRYFPGEDGEATERVGKKTPRRDRPPIQECLRRGQEVAVQVLKEGVGTKGPTVTSYLSVPGRFLVMMPQMDKVGVSRKVEDEETRRKMRDILDQLDLPEGFGFIVRTAGMDRNKTELKRDLAYLQRLWKDIEKRWKANTGRPRLLYSESDLLVRTLRDILTTDMHRVVVDNDLALQRAARFLKIVSPRSTTRLVHYTGKTPIYHALGVEEQIQRIHAREVPLPSGGRLVIDETEALVAIDVNSGKSRDARDAETNAFRTNIEAADEICRQLRLRDMGGIVINDLIDMRSMKHRREVEGRFRDNLKRDRARSSITAISQFGILEMTRQRMRGSHESIHFSGCQTCRGRGLVQRPDSVAGDALRDMAAILDHDRVWRVEMVVNPRIAGELLSGKRRSLSRLERTLGKRVDVRVSEAVPIDRVTFYAYDERGADVDISKLSVRRAGPDQLVTMDFVSKDVDNWADGVDEPPMEEHVAEDEHAEADDVHPIELDEEDAEVSAEGWGSVPEADRRSGRGRGGGGRDGRGGRGERGGRGGDDRQRDGARGGQRNNQRGPGSPSGSQGGPRPARPARAEAAPVDPDASDARSDAHGDIEGDDNGEGGRRRRRRRRRGGRGRGRGREGVETITGGEHAEGDGDHAPSEHDDHADHTEQGDTHDDTEHTESHEDGDEGDVHADGEHAEGNGEHGEHGEPGEGGRRRRRRRRGGRGRGRAREGDTGEGAESSGGDQRGGGERGERSERGGGGGQRAPRSEPRDQHTNAGNGRRGSPSRSDSSRAEPPAPKPAAAKPADDKPAKPAPRSLYGSRRKLGPGERRSPGREE